MSIVLWVVLLITFGQVCSGDDSDWAKAREHFQRGEYQQAIDLARANLNATYYLDEDWLLLKVNAEMAGGRYSQARDSIELGLEELPRSIRIRWIGASVYRFNNDPRTAKQLMDDIGLLIERSSWRYNDAENRVVVGRYLLSNGIDAKRVLDEIYAKARDDNPALPVASIAMGQLALEKCDYELAAQNFNKAIELDPNEPDAWYGLARAYAPNQSEKSAAALSRAMEINPRHTDSLLLIAEQQMAAEDFDKAETRLRQILEVNPSLPDAWAFLAVLAHLENDPVAEGKYRANALQAWRGNPRVDYLIGSQLSKKYRFVEGRDYQRRALVYDEKYLPAKLQLAQDLLRLGEEDEGWRLAQEVFDADRYNVLANNLVALRDHLSQFATIENDGIIIRMDPSEAATYGHLVEELIDEAAEVLTQKYEVELEKPITIEIFSRQQDFAIRTFGVPGGAGYLGVCFGRVVTMNSPAAQGATMTSWREVLWHEFCHVVSLQKTKNRMPRWLSEGISVYEETVANHAWGDALSPRYREMILSGKTTPVSRLSSAFLDPPSPEHLRFAYYQSSLVVRYLIERFGQAKLNRLLDDLAFGTPINQALSQHTLPIDRLDEEFASYLRQMVTEVAPQVDWTKPEDTLVEVAAWDQWLSEHPDNYYGLLGRAASLMAAGDYAGALVNLNRLLELVPNDKNSVVAYKRSAECFRKLDDIGAETAALEQVLRMDADDSEACLRLLELHAAAERWDDVIRVARQLQGIQPMLKSSHHWMALAAEKMGDDSQAIRSLSSLLALGPFDRADVHYRLARAYFRQGQLGLARNNVLLSLDAAPRFREAHRLLLEIVASNEQSGSSAGAAPATETANPNRSESDQ